MAILKTLCKHILSKTNNLRSGPVRCVSQSGIFKTAYDTDGKTSVTIMNKEPGIGILVDTYSQSGFRLNNGMFVVGPVAVFPNTVLSWNVSGDDDITEESLSLFTLLEPKLDILIVGYGNTSVERLKLDRMLLSLRHKRKLNVEILPTEKAIPTFNFLNAERRYVAAALVPPARVSLTDEDIAAAKARRTRLYDED